MLHIVRSRCSRNNDPLLRVTWRRVCKLTRPAPASQIGTSTRLTNIFLLPNALAHNEIQFQLLMRSSVLAYCQIRVHTYILIALFETSAISAMFSVCLDAWTQLGSQADTTLNLQKWNFQSISAIFCVDDWLWRKAYNTSNPLHPLKHFCRTKAEDHSCQQKDKLQKAGLTPILEIS